jgi:cAMP phosphodiesterase
VKVTVVPSSVAATGLGSDQFLISYIINDTIAIDAGSLGFFGNAIDQSRVRHIFLSHSHIDHVASLPIFLENCFDGNPECVTVHASQNVIESLRKDLFNGRIWPDFIGMTSPATPFVKINPIEAGESITIDGVTINVVAVNHLVPTVGYIIDDGITTVVIPSDTGPTDEIWKLTSARPHVKAVFLEAAFPNRMDGLAKISKHLTPAGFALETQKLTIPVDWYAIHIKSRFRAEVIRELEALKLPRLHIGEFGRTYEF